MDYQKIYNNLIDRARFRILDCYLERHHIIPKCVGGLDKEDNLVDLLPEEHYLAHQLLAKIYPNNRKLLHAARMMTICDGIQQRNNKLYGWIKRKISELGCSDETKLKIGNANRNPSQETRIKMSSYRKNKTNKEIMGEKKAKETSIKHKEDGENRIWITDGIISKHISKDQPIPNGFTLGRDKKIQEHLKYIAKTRPSRKGIPRTEDDKIKMRKTKSIESKQNYKKSALRRAKSIICVETGVIYESASEAIRKTGLAVDVAARKGRKSGGFHWKYLENQ